MSEDLAKIEDALFEVCDEYLKDEKYKQFDARRTIPASSSPASDATATEAT